MTQFDPKERIGVANVETVFLQMGWIPRSVFQSDIGIDMYVEICELGKPTGKFIGVQIKTGESYFKEKKSGSYIYRPDSAHVEYWIKNSLPIIVVLHNPNSGITIWEVIKESTVEKKKVKYKMMIAEDKSLDVDSKDLLLELTEDPPLISKFKRLLLDIDIIRKLQEGKKLTIDLRSWVNKTSGKADIKIIEELVEANHEKGVKASERVLQEYTAIGVYGHQSLFSMFPYADFKIDSEFYEYYSEYDEDNVPGYKLVFNEDRFHGYHLPVIPYSDNGETASYRLQMHLNDYGKSFLNFHEFIGGYKQLELKLN